MIQKLQRVHQKLQRVHQKLWERKNVSEECSKISSDKGNSSSGNEPKDENEQIIEDVFGNKEYA
ncbi:MAG: hypothetical protein ACLR7D_16980 [Lachnospira eligens]